MVCRRFNWGGRPIHIPLPLNAQYFPMMALQGYAVNSEL